ncbi:DUF4168 domain-containing protein [Roseibium salinum]|uniref:DUF4168 domain-containing protein n=1 Tax=Roseibium salinum TaxID=1604349 RepID=A0ABT3R2B2_9HYPH|nr:DUF4168 domain-containing protein [Roseibium sp. DSM 29163]MCX2723271.1 DUF4168 domain-containing protein [Roseibium sp. DSM 29163]
MLTFAASVVPVQAQQSQQPAPETQQPSDYRLNDETLKAFAQASLDVEGVLNEWTPRIETAEGDEADQLRDQANREIVDAVQTNGLEVQTYNQIYEFVKASPDVAVKVQQYRQQMK